MKWSQLSSVQRAYLACGAMYAKDKLVQGKVVRGKARGAEHGRFAIQEQGNAKALATQSLIDRQRDADRLKAATNKAWMLALVATSDVKITKLPHGAARGAGKPGWMGRRGMGGGVLPPGLFGGLRNGR